MEAFRGIFDSKLHMRSISQTLSTLCVYGLFDHRCARFIMLMIICWEVIDENMYRRWVDKCNMNMDL